MLQHLQNVSSESNTVKHVYANASKFKKSFLSIKYSKTCLLKWSETLCFIFVPCTLLRSSKTIGWCTCVQQTDYCSQHMPVIECMLYASHFQSSSQRKCMQTRWSVSGMHTHKKSNIQEEETSGSLSFIMIQCLSYGKSHFIMVTYGVLS